MANAHIDQHIKDWKQLVKDVETEIASGREKWVDPSVGAAMFKELTTYWQYNDFNTAAAKALSDKFKATVERPLSANSFKTKLSEIRAIFNKTHVNTDKATFEEFQKAMGGKKQRTEQERREQEQREQEKREQEKREQERRERERKEQEKRGVVILWNDGSYAGDLDVSGRPHGQGEWRGINGDWEKGTYKNGDLHGNNCSYYNAQNKRTDTGTFTNGSRSGSGTMKWDNGSWYKGGWNSYGRHGVGEEHYSNGSWQKGTYVNDNLNGQGEYHFKDGRWYTGNYVDDKEVGEFTQYFTDGRVEQGTWDKNGNWHKREPKNYSWFVLIAFLGYCILTYTLLFGFFKIIGVWILGLIVFTILAKIAEKRSKTTATVCTCIYAVFALVIIQYNIPKSSNNKSSNPEPISQSVTEKYYVTAQSLIVRSGAGTSYQKLGSLKNGDQIEVFKINNGWAEIKYNGRKAYVSTQFLKLKDASGENIEILSQKPANTGKKPAVSGESETATVSTDAKQSETEKISTDRAMGLARSNFTSGEYNNALNYYRQAGSAGKVEGYRKLRDKAKELISVYGECNDTVKKILLLAKELDDTQEIRNLIANCSGSHGNGQQQQTEKISETEALTLARKAFEAGYYDKAANYFRQAGEEGKAEGYRTFLNKATELESANGACGQLVISALRRAQGINDTQEVRRLIDRCK